MPVLARLGEAGGLRPAPGGQGLRRPRPLRLRSRTNGCAAARCGAGCRRATPDRPIYDLRDRRHAPACPSRASTSTTSASTTRCSARRCPTRTSRRAPTGYGRADRSAPAAARRRAPGAVSRRHLLHGRPRSALGHQARSRRGEMAMMERYKQPRHRPGADAAAGARQHPLPVHHAEAARGARARRSRSKKRGHHGRLLRRHRDDAAVPSLRASRSCSTAPTSRPPTATR